MSSSAQVVRLPTPTLVAIVATELVALGSLTVPLMLGLALAVNRIDTGLEAETALSVVTALGALSAMVANPLLGAWCDRTRDRGLGRAGFLAGGVALGTVAVALLPLATNVATLTVVWMLAQAAFNATFVALYGLMADLVDESDRARVSGWFGAAAVASVVVGMGLVTVLPKNLWVVFLAMPALALPVTASAFRHIRRLPRPSAPAHGGFGWREQVGSLRGHPQYWRVWVQRLMVQFGYGLVTIYGLFFLIRRADLGESEAATWVSASSALGAALSALAAVIFGSLAGRRGAYGRFIVFSVVLLMAALTVKLFGVSVTAYVVAAVLAGIGVGCYYAVDLALVLRTVPGERAALFLGFFNIARTLPQSLVPAVAPMLLMIGDGDLVGDSTQNYAALYALGLVVMVLSVIPLRGMTALRRGT